MPSKPEMHVRESDEKTLCTCVWIQLYSSLIWEAGKCWHVFQLAYCMCFNTLFSFQHFPFESSNIQTKFILSGLYILQMKKNKRKENILFYVSCLIKLLKLSNQLIYHSRGNDLKYYFQQWIMLCYLSSLKLTHLSPITTKNLFPITKCSCKLCFWNVLFIYFFLILHLPF